MISFSNSWLGFSRIFPCISLIKKLIDSSRHPNVNGFKSFGPRRYYFPGGTRRLIFCEVESLILFNNVYMFCASGLYYNIM
jgi:hypothetical protein